MKASQLRCCPQVAQSEQMTGCQVTWIRQRTCVLAQLPTLHLQNRGETLAKSALAVSVAMDHLARQAPRGRRSGSNAKVKKYSESLRQYWSTHLLGRSVDLKKKRRKKIGLICLRRCSSKYHLSMSPPSRQKDSFPMGFRVCSKGMEGSSGLKSITRIRLA